MEPTPLLVLLRCLDSDQRETLALWSGTTVNYLYSLAGGHRNSPRAELAFRIEDASVRLSKENGGKLPVVTAREIATMAALRGLNY